MKVKVIKDRYSTTMTSINLDILKLLANPLVVTSKDAAPLFNLSFNQVTKPTKRAGFDHGGSSWLVLDYDNGYTYENWLTKYEQLINNTYFAYSSYNNKPDKQKYRIVIPLDRVYTDVEWKAMTRHLIKKFPENDQCSFQTSRFHNVPCKTDHYFYHVNKGTTKLNLMEYLEIDNGFLALLVSKVADIPDEQPEVPLKASVIDFKVLGDMTVREWLSTPLKAEGGNGGLRTRGAYSSYQLCKRYGDTDTLALVKGKCYRCGLAKWFDRQN